MTNVFLSLLLQIIKAVKFVIQTFISFHCKGTNSFDPSRVLILDPAQTHLSIADARKGYK